MGFWEQFPYTNFHEVNLNYIFKTLKELLEKFEDFKAINEVTYGGIWDINRNYSAWTIVAYENNAYISKKPVSRGIPIENRDYWILASELDPRIMSLTEEVEKIKAKLESYGVFNIRLYGAVGDGITDDSEAIKTAIAAAENRAIFVPTGSYLCNNIVDFGNISALYGEGSISRLIWHNSPAGITFNIPKLNPTESQSLSIKDIYLGCTGDGNDVALTIDGSDSIGDRFTPRPVIDNVIIGPVDSYIITEGWNSGILLKSCNGVMISNCGITGRKNSTGKALHITSPTELHGTEFLIQSSKLTHFDTAVYSDIFEGLELNQVVAICKKGVVIHGTANYPHVSIAESHFNCTDLCFDLTNCKEIFITNNLFYLRADSENARIGVLNTSSRRFVVQGNIFNTENDAVKTYQLVVRGKDGVIAHNIFCGDSTPNILVQDPASNVRVIDNISEDGTIVAGERDRAIVGSCAGQIVKLDRTKNVTRNYDVWFDTDGNMYFKTGDSFKRISTIDA